MNEPNSTSITPAEEDPVVHGWLASLPELAPRLGFEDAVMSRVRVPAPSWVLSVQNATRHVFAGKRVWMWAGGLAATSAVSLAIVVTLTVSYWMQVETAWSLFATGFAVEAWRAVVTVAAKTASTGFALSAFWGFNFKMLTFAGLAGALVTVTSLWGLYRILSVETERITFDASR